MKIEIPTGAAYILQQLNKHGYEAYIVGGCVRDSLLGKQPNDWDITTSAKPEEVKAIFHRTIDTGIQHGTVTVLVDREILDDGRGSPASHTDYAFEVTTYRVDGVYTDHRRPESVCFTASLEEDLKRRDFTINAMAYNDTAGLVDAFDGIGDLKRHVIRCVGIPHDRFGEDALRMLRAVRFAAQLGFSIEEKTRQAVADLADNLQKVSAERIQTEMVKLLTSAHPEEMRTVYELGLSRVFLPEFDRMMETPQITKHHCYSVGEHTIHAMQEVQQDRILRLTMLLHDVAKPVCVTTDEKGQNHFKGHPAEGAEMARVILRRLKFDNETIKRVCLLVRYHDDRPAVTPRNVRRAISRIGVENMEALFAVKRADTLAQSMYERQKKLSYIDAYEETYREILKEHQCVQKKDLAINGRDLIAQGMKTGKEMGEVLQALYEQVLDEPQLNNKETLLALALQLQQTKQE